MCSLLLHLPVLDGDDEVSGSKHGRGIKNVPDRGKERKQSGERERQKSEFVDGKQVGKKKRAQEDKRMVERREKTKRKGRKAKGE